MRGVNGIHTGNVPCVNGVKNFSLDQYQNRDNSRAKRKAAAWGNGDFKSVLRQNMDRYCEDYSVKVPQSIIMPETNHRELVEVPVTQTPKKKNHNDRNPKPEFEEGAKHKVGYRQRKFLMSLTGIKIDKLMRKHKTNIRRVSRVLGMKYQTLTNAMKPNAPTKRSTYEDIAHYFNVSVDWLIGEDDGETFDEARTDK